MAFGVAHGFWRDVGEAELQAGAEIGLHGALPVGGDEHMAPGGWRAFGGGIQADVDAQRAHVVIENGAELVCFDLADVGGRAAEIGKAGDRICNRAARHFRRRPHLRVEFARLLFIDQRHRAGHGADVFEEVVFDVSEYVDDGVADAEKLDGM